MKLDSQSAKTGIPLIDNQHAAYFDTAERAIAICKKRGIQISDIREVLADVQKYAVEHFDTEEHLMRTEKYPHFDEHRAKHLFFREKLDGFMEELEEGIDLDDLAFRMTKWLITWVLVQIQTDDVKMAAFLKKRKKKSVS